MRDIYARVGRTYYRAKFWRWPNGGSGGRPRLGAPTWQAQAGVRNRLGTATSVVLFFWRTAYAAKVGCIAAGCATLRPDGNTLIFRNLLKVRALPVGRQI